MREKYIVYLKNSKKVFEAETFEEAARFVENKEHIKRISGDSEFDKYEIVKAIA